MLGSVAPSMSSRPQPGPPPEEGLALHGASSLSEASDSRTGAPGIALEHLHRWALTAEGDDRLDRWLGSPSTPETAHLVNRPFGPAQRTLLHTLATRRPPRGDVVVEAIRLGGDVHARDVHSAQPLHLALGWSRELRDHAIAAMLDFDLSRDFDQTPSFAGKDFLGVHHAEAWARPLVSDGHPVVGTLGDKDLSSEDITRIRRSAVGAFERARRRLRDGEHLGAVEALVRAGADPLAALTWRHPSEEDLELPPAPSHVVNEPAHQVDALTLAALGGHYRCFRSVYRAASAASRAPDPLRRALRLSLVAEFWERVPAEGVKQQRRISLCLASGLWNLALRAENPRREVTQLMNLTLLPRCNHISLRITRQVASAGAEQARSWVNHEHSAWSSMLGVALMRGVEEATVRAMLQMGACPIAPVGPHASVKVPPVFWAARLYDLATIQLLTMILVDLGLLDRRRKKGPDGRCFPNHKFEDVATQMRRLCFLTKIPVIRSLVEYGARPTDCVSAWRTAENRLVCTALDLAPPTLAPRPSQPVFSLSLLDLAVARDDLDLASYLYSLEAIRRNNAMRAQALSTFRPSDAMRRVLSA